MQGRQNAEIVFSRTRGHCVTIVSLVSENFKNTIPVLMAFKDENWWKTDPSDEAVQ